MVKLDDYAKKYHHVRIERREGILQMTLHDGAGGSLKWNGPVHEELGFAFADVANDPENRVVILTGAGDDFIAAMDFASFSGAPLTAHVWDQIYREGKRLLMNLLDIGVPVIAAVNGPALIHAELAVMSDIVLASESAVFQDAPHFPGGTVPGDGVHVVWPLVLGVNRGRYFLLTGQKLSAREALGLGVVSEVLPRERLLPRAWELAGELAKKPPLTLRYAREAITQQYKRLMLDQLGHGLAIEGLGALAPRGGTER